MGAEFGEKKIGSGMLVLIIAVVLALMVITAARQDNTSPTGIDSNYFSSASSFFSFGDSNKSGGALKPEVSTVEVFFCPMDSCANHLISKIDSAKSSVYVAIYSLTHDGVADALKKAKDRGVEVKVIFDKDQSMNDASDDEYLAQGGVLVSLRNGRGYMHNKYTIIDGAFVATGSFNYSQNADTKNEENLVFIENSEIAKRYKADFDRIWDLSDRAQ